MYAIEVIVAFISAHFCTCCCRNFWNFQFCCRIYALQFFISLLFCCSCLAFGLLLNLCAHVFLLFLLYLLSVNFRVSCWCLALLLGIPQESYIRNQNRIINTCLCVCVCVSVLFMGNRKTGKAESKMLDNKFREI